MNRLKCLRSFLAVLALGAGLWSTAASAAPIIVFESGDAGDTLATAQDVRVGAPYELLIKGSLSLEPASLDLVDLYWLNVAKPYTLAHTGIGDPGLIADPVLFLFNSSGQGVAMDDESGGFGQAFLGVLEDLPVGEYFLAIAFAGMDPLDGGGNSIFDVFGSGGVLSAGALASWSGAPFATDPSVIGGYELAVSNVPVPGSLWLVAVGLTALSASRRRNRA